MPKSAVAQRFRGFLPVVVDVETGGFNAATDALLEIAAVLIDWDDARGWHRTETLAHHVVPFEGARLEESALRFNNAFRSDSYLYGVVTDCQRLWLQ